MTKRGTYKAQNHEKKNKRMNQEREGIHLTEELLAAREQLLEQWTPSSFSQAFVLLQEYSLTLSPDSKG
jgi:hypothetical protein